MRYAKKWELNAEYNMTQEQKDLLLKDLCARLPYGVKLKKNYGTDDTPVELCGLDVDKNTVNICTFRGKSIMVCDNNIPLFIGMWKSRYLPYLFPMSSMTEKQKNELDQLLKISLKALMGEITDTDVDTLEFDFYNKYHLDLRDLIPKGLALDATGLNIY